MKALIVIFFVSLFLLIIYFIQPKITGYFAESNSNRTKEIQSDVAKNKTGNKWYLVGTISIKNGSIKSINYTEV